MREEKAMVPKKRIASVVGNARPTALNEACAEELGRVLVDAGFRVLSGGLGGVMQAASRGARSSSKYYSGDVIGVLPGYDATAANEFVDIPICTGLDYARNVIVAASGDVVFAIGGGAGTLSEIAVAWSLGKPIIVVGGPDGWATELAGRRLDDRRNEPIYGPCNPVEAVQVAIDLLNQDRPKPKGV